MKDEKEGVHYRSAFCRWLRFVICCVTIEVAAHPAQSLPVASFRNLLVTIETAAQPAQPLPVASFCNLRMTIEAAAQPAQPLPVASFCNLRVTIEAAAQPAQPLPVASFCNLRVTIEAAAATRTACRWVRFAIFASRRPFFTVVKSRVNARIRRNSNRIFILYNDRIFIDFGFVRHIFRQSVRIDRRLESVPLTISDNEPASRSVIRSIHRHRPPSWVPDPPPSLLRPPSSVLNPTRTPSSRCVICVIASYRFKPTRQPPSGARTIIVTASSIWDMRYWRCACVATVIWSSKMARCARS